ncbi:MAG: hypothetical protein ACI4S3_02635 [Candidatus Gastranaerophilaceae bacterium]
MTTLKEKQDKKPLIFQNLINKNSKHYEKPYKYSYKDSVNNENGTPFVKTQNHIVNLDTMTETFGSDAGDDAYYYLDLDTLTESFSDSGDDIRRMN